MKRLTLLLFFSCFLLLQTKAQEQTTSPTKNSITKFELGYHFGGDFSNYYLAYHGGFGLGIFQGFKVSKQFSMHGGMGIEQLKDGILLPMMVDFDYYNKKQNRFINFKTGYSIGWNTTGVGNKAFKYKGGGLVSMGYGFKLFEKEKLQGSLLLSYNFRETHVQYQREENGEIIAANRTIHLLSIKTSLKF